MSVFPIAVLTDALDGMGRPEAFHWCAERGVAGVELGVGGYSAAPHLDRAALLADGGARSAITDELRSAGLELVALNASGNPLHPDGGTAAEHDAALRDALRLAAELGVERVVAMSGCPGGPGGGAWPIFAGGAWLPDMEGLPEFQWERIVPYWSELSRWAEEAAPGVAICLELHPGTSVYNAASYARLAAEVGPNVVVNLDPSHFWWQGIDPETTIAELGPAVRFAHGKDTVLHPDRIARHGVLDFRWPSAASEMPWHFCAVGSGRSGEQWAALLGSLRAAGYAGPISIEHEDPDLTPEAGIEASLAGLRTAIALLDRRPG
jgi:sugar phosphate isomerase/epimerase